MATFIKVEIDKKQIERSTAKQLVEVCPVDIFEWRKNELDIDPTQEDECTLCELCLATAPPGAVKIHKLYSREVLVADRGKMQKL